MDVIKDTMLHLQEGYEKAIELSGTKHQPKHHRISGTGVPLISCDTHVITAAPHLQIRE